MIENQPFRVYKGDGDRLVEASKESQRCILLPAGDPSWRPASPPGPVPMASGVRS